MSFRVTIQNDHIELNMTSNSVLLVSSEKEGTKMHLKSQWRKKNFDFDL